MFRSHAPFGDGKRRYGPRGIERGLRLYIVACAVNGLLALGFVMLRANLA